MSAVISDRDQPLGRAVGNAIEVREAIDMLNGKGPSDFTELVYTLGTRMLILGGKASDESDARNKLEKAVSDGSALNRLAQFVKAQGGDDKFVYEPDRLKLATIVTDITSPQDGYISHIDCEEIGICSLMLGGGRETKESEIDLSVGLLLDKKTGDMVKKGDKIATVYSSDENKTGPVIERFLKAYHFSSEKCEKQKLIKGII